MGLLHPSNTYIHLETSFTGKSQQAFGVGLSRQAISYSFDFAVGAAEELDFTLGIGSITRANATILIEI